MINLKNIYFLMALYISGSSCVQSCPQNIIWTKLPDLAVGNNPTQGVSAPFAGMHNGVLLVAGGCNFPDVPVAEGGTKVFYKDIYRLDNDSEADAKWILSGTLPEPVAYGISVSTSRGVICIGGENSTQKFSSVLRIQWNAETKNIVVDSLPSLPATMDNLAGAQLGDFLYVAGGIINGVPGNECYRLNLGNVGQGWETLPPIPGTPRVQPIAVVQQCENEECLFVLGGFTPNSQGVEGKALTDGWVFHPKINKWTAVPSVEPQGQADTFAINGGVGMAVGQQMIVCMGGVNKEIFNAALARERALRKSIETNETVQRDSIKAEMKSYLRQPQEWYRFNKSVFLYHTKTKKWSVLNDYPQAATAGSALVPVNDGFYLIGGELKPGIRSKYVWKGEIK